MAMSAVVWIAVAAAAEPLLPEADLRAGERAWVASVVDGDTFKLTTERQVRLVGLQAPKLPQGPLAEEAWAALNDMLSGRQITLH